MNKILVSMVGIIMAAGFLVPSHQAQASSRALPSLKSVVTSNQSGPRVLGDTTGSSELDDLFGQFMTSLTNSASTSLYHIPNVSNTLAVLANKLTYNVGETISVTVTGLQPYQKTSVAAFGSSGLFSSTSNGNQPLFASSTIADSTGVVNMQSRALVSSDTGPLVVLAAGPLSTTSGQNYNEGYKLGMTRVMVGQSEFATFTTTSLPNGNVGSAYTAETSFAVSTTSPVYFLVMSVPRGISIVAPDVPSGSTTMSTIPFLGQTFLAEGAIPVNGKITLRFFGAPTEPGKDFMLFMAGSQETLVDVNVLTITVTGTAAVTTGLTVPDQGLQIPGTGLQMPDEGPTIPTGNGLQIPGGNGLQIPTSSFRTIPQGEWGFIKTDSNKFVYYVSPEGYKYPVLSLKVFYSYGNKLENVRNIDQDEFDGYPTTYFMRLRGSSAIYKIEGSTKRLVPSSLWNSSNHSAEEVMDVNKTEFNAYKTGKKLTVLE